MNDHLPIVSIIILNWNNPADTLECLESVYQLKYPNYRVTVVDNGSTDDSSSKISGKYPQIDYLQLGRNLGYAEGNNKGITYALEKYNPDYVFILNNDTLLDPGLIDDLVEVGESNPRAVILGPTVFCTQPADHIFAAGSFVNWAQGTISHRGMFQPAQEGQYPEKTNPVDFLVGCGILIRRKFITEAGMFDPLYYLNFEDVDWGIRAWKFGYEVVHVPQAILWHKVSATLGLASPANTYYITRNSLLFFWSNARGLRKFLSPARILITTIRTIIAWTIRGKYQTNIYKRKRSANLLAIRDFFIGKYGRMGRDVEEVCFCRK